MPKPRIVWSKAARIYTFDLRRHGYYYSMCALPDAYWDGVVELNKLNGYM